MYLLGFLIITVYNFGVSRHNVGMLSRYQCNFNEEFIGKVYLTDNKPVARYRYSFKYRLQAPWE